MARNLHSRTKRQRRIGEKLFVHGEKAFSRRPYPPGQHGPKGAGRASEYGVRLREKQKAQLTYGLLERQFRRYFEKAKRKVGNTGEYLLQLLEQRLDNVVYRAGLAPSREAARQLVSHGHISVNGATVDIPSFHVGVGRTVMVRERSAKKTGLQNISKALENYQAPAWLTVSKNTLSATVESLPTVDITSTNTNPQLIVEFYSR